MDTNSTGPDREFENFGITGYYNPGRLPPVGSQDTDLSDYLQ